MNKIIYKKIVVPVNTNSAYEWFILESKITNWLCDKATIDANERGKYELYWNSSNAKYNNTVGCKINIYDYGKVLGFDWKGPKEFSAFMNQTQPLTQVTIFFNSLDENITEIILIHSGWKSSEKWIEAFKWFQLAWDEALRQLLFTITSEDKKSFW